MNPAPDQPIPEPQKTLPASRFTKVWLLIAILVALLLAFVIGLALWWTLRPPIPAPGPAAPAPTIFASASPSSAPPPAPIASFRNDFRPETPDPRWRYYWNRNGPVGDTNSYVELVWNGTVYATTTAPLPAPAPARYLRLSDHGGHPGYGPSQSFTLGIDYEYAAIAAFTVPEPGSYALIHSMIARHRGPKRGSVHLQIFVNHRETGPDLYCRSEQGVAFDRALGRLAAGDRIFVTIGADETDVDDSFDLDFEIGRY